MNLEHRIKMTKTLKWLLSIAVIFFVIFWLILTSSLVFSQKYENKIYPGITVNDIELGGLSLEQAQNIIESDLKNIFESGFTFKFEDRTKNIETFSAETPILIINSDSMAKTSYDYGRTDTFWKNFYKKLILLIKGKELALDYQLNKRLLKQELKQEFSYFEDPAQNALIQIDVINAIDREFKISFSEEKNGTALNYDDQIINLENNLKNFKNSSLTFEKNPDQPKVSQFDAQKFNEQITKLLLLDDIVFVYQDEKFEIKWEDYSHWLKFATDSEEQIVITLDENMVYGQLEAIAQNINQESQNAKFQMVDGRVTEFVASSQGQELDLQKSYEKIVNEIINLNNSRIELIVSETSPKITTESLNNLGINELIGAGESNFSGSPTNRRHNIAVGAATFNGMLIAPDEEFSFVTNLGNVDASSGYLPELVIKGNKTIPEYGGGLCQVATTMFRVALETGLPITERSPHSYRVSYYEPAGTDATIYQPSPDLKFVNDTGHYILIQSIIEGNILTFEMYGTSDDRKVEMTKPYIFNITSPGPTKLVETTELAPGVKKCTESAHAGADAVFYRTITTADGEEKKETWSSHYSPWQAVCLIGVDPNATTTVEE